MTSDGEFSDSASGDLRYRPGPGPRRITLLSRNGLLPRVRARKMEFRPRHFTQKNLRSLLKRHAGTLGLEAIFALLDKELSAALGESFDWQAVTAPSGSPQERLDPDLRNIPAKPFA